MKERVKGTAGQAASARMFRKPAVMKERVKGNGGTFRTVPFVPLMLVLMMLVCAGFAEEGGNASGEYTLPDQTGDFTGVFALPEKNNVFSKEFALQMLTCSSGYKEEETSRIMREAGFEPVLKAHYDKADNDPSHTCVFMVGNKRMADEKNVYLMVIRGTRAAEWYSNFDMAPSGNRDTQWAENFLACAQDALVRIQELLDGDPEAVWVVTGHSRGAACANILGLMLNSMRNPELNYIYTSATPTTLRGGEHPFYDGNIFNLINPADLVPRLPLAAWGYRRAGTDILLPAPYGLTAQLDTMTDPLAELAPTIEDYYTKRHLLNGPGTGEEGLTAFDILTMLAESMAGITVDVEDDGNLETDRGGGGAGSQLDAVSEESDIYPLFAFLEKMNGEMGQVLLTQHLPTTYDALLRMMK